MKHYAIFTLIWSSFTLSNDSYSRTSPVLEYSATYLASTNGIGATTKCSLARLADDSYRLTSILEAKQAEQTLANLAQSSELLFENEDLLAQNYFHLRQPCHRLQLGRRVGSQQ